MNYDEYRRWLKNNANKENRIVYGSETSRKAIEYARFTKKVSATIIDKTET